MTTMTMMSVERHSSYAAWPSHDQWPSWQSTEGSRTKSGWITTSLNIFRIVLCVQEIQDIGELSKGEVASSEDAGCMDLGFGSRYETRTQWQSLLSLSLLILQRKWSKSHSQTGLTLGANHNRDHEDYSGYTSKFPPLLRKSLFSLPRSHVWSSQAFDINLHKHGSFTLNALDEQRQMAKV